MTLLSSALPLTLLMDVAPPTAFEEGLWQGIFQLAALAIVAFWVHFVYQRFRQRADARQEMIDEIDEFSVALYRPRKLYALLIDTRQDCLGSIRDEGVRETRRAEMRHSCLSDLIEAIGRFRAVQVKLVPLYGYHQELFGYYMAIWRYLKEVRTRMQKGESLYFHHEKAESVDAFFRLLDGFRYRILTASFAGNTAGLLRPPKEALDLMRKRGNELYAEYFG
ncbi:MAG: hypothetical protein AB7K09_06875, partial [Planctomycetota bacterium]